MGRRTNRNRALCRATELGVGVYEFDSRILLTAPKGYAFGRSRWHDRRIERDRVTPSGKTVEIKDSVLWSRVDHWIQNELIVCRCKSCVRFRRCNSQRKY